MSRYYQLSKVGRVARRTAILSLILTVGELALFIGIGRVALPPLELVMLAVVQLLPGTIVLLLSGAVGRGDPTAYFVILAAAILAPVRSFLTFFVKDAGIAHAGICFDLFTSLPLLFLIVTCKESFAEVRQVIRRRREDRLTDQRGFSPVMSGVDSSRAKPFIGKPVPLREPPVIQSPAQPIPSRPRRTVMSHYMNHATYFAGVVGALSLVRGLILVAVNYAVRVHSGGKEVLDVTMENVLVFYGLPAVILLLLAWRMDKHAWWAFPVCTVVAIALIIRVMFSVAVFRAARIQVAYLAYGADVALQLPSIWLLMKCIYAMPDVWDIRRQQLRQESLDLKSAAAGSKPVPTLATITPPPASGTHFAPHPPRDIQT